MSKDDFEIVCEEVKKNESVADSWIFSALTLLINEDDIYEEDNNN